jgi:hypothetical protein
MTLSACPWANVLREAVRTTTLDTTDRRAPGHHPHGMKRRHGDPRLAYYFWSELGVRPRLSRKRRTHIDLVTRPETPDPRLRNAHRTRAPNVTVMTRREARPIGTSPLRVRATSSISTQQSSALACLSPEPATKPSNSSTRSRTSTSARTSRSPHGATSRWRTTPPDLRSALAVRRRAGARTRAQIGGALTRRYGSPWSDARYKPARAAGSAASSIRCSSPETRPPSLDRRSEATVRFRLEGQLWVR